MSKAKMALRISAMSAVGALALGALTVGSVAPAAAASDVTLTIWTFGDVIQPALVREYKTLQATRMPESMEDAQTALEAVVRRPRGQVLQRPLGLAGGVCEEPIAAQSAAGAGPAAAVGADRKSVV